MEEANEERIKCETKKGVKLELGFNGSHWIAYDEENKKYGAPFISINDLKDSLGIDYDKSIPCPEIAKKEAEFTPIRVRGELEDGTEVHCVKDRHHWRCFDKDDKQIGQPFVNLHDLEESVKVIVSVSKTDEATGIVAGTDDMPDGELASEEKTAEELHEETDCEEGDED